LIELFQNQHIISKEILLVKITVDEMDKRFDMRSAIVLKYYDKIMVKK